MYTSFGHGHVIPAHLPSDLKGSPFLVCSRTRGGSTIGPGCGAGTHRRGWCLNVLQHPIIKWRRSIWDGSPAGPRGPSVFHEKQCPLPPPHCFLSLSTHPYGLIYSICFPIPVSGSLSIRHGFSTHGPWWLILEVRAPWEDFPHFFFIRPEFVSGFTFFLSQRDKFLLTKVYLLPDSLPLAE